MPNGLRESLCPGCGLHMPSDESAVCRSYFNTSPECWMVFTEVLGAEFGNAVLFGQVHQLTVDAYAVQHAGGSHPDKSVAVHLCGLHLAMRHGIRPVNVPKLLQRLVKKVTKWPHFQPPADRGALTVRDVATAGSFEGHVDASRRWAKAVWSAWSQHHADVAAFVAHHLAPVDMEMLKNK